MRQKLVFHHIPKCGGTSLDAALRGWYGPPPHPPGCLRFDPVAGRTAAALLGIDEARQAEATLLYLLAQRDARYVSGHLPFSAAAHRAFAGEWEFITILRHPVARWFSHYFYNRHAAGSPWAIDAALEEFVTTERALRIANASLLYLSGREMPDILSQPQACVAQAIANLGKFAVVGCLERLDDLVRRLEARYGAPLPVPRLQINPLPPAAQTAQISAAVRARVEEMCRADLQVYAAVQAR